MKKRIISTLLLSTVLLSTAASLTTVSADTTDSKIAQQDKTISSAQSAKADAQSKMSSLQSSVDSLKSKQAKAQAQLDETVKQAEQLSKQIASLRESIKERSVAIEAQARSAQVNSSATNSITTVLDSKSLTDAIQKVVAMATVSGASQQMLQQQQDEEKSLQSKLVEMQKNVGMYDKLNNDLAAQAKELSDQQAQLKVATINYQLTITTAEGKKSALLAEKATAEAAAKKAAEAQAAYQAQQKTAQAQSTTVNSNSSSSNSGSSSNSNSGSSSSSNSGNSNSGSSSNNGGSSSSNNGGSSSSNNGGSTGSTGGGSTNTGNGYVSFMHGTASSNNYAYQNCTWYVWNYFRDVYKTYLPSSLGNGAEWAYSLPGTSKHAGAIVSFRGGTYIQFVGGGGFTTASPFGHVAVVTAVYSDGSYQIYNGSTAGVDSYHVSASTPATFVSGGK